jgi:hypothetical protein
LKEKVAAPVWKAENTALGIRCPDHATLSICKSWHQLRRHAAIAMSVEFACGLMPRSLFSFFCILFVFPKMLDGRRNVSNGIVFLKWVVSRRVRKETAVCQGNCSQLYSLLFFFFIFLPVDRWLISNAREKYSQV